MQETGIMAEEASPAIEAKPTENATDHVPVRQQLLRKLTDLVILPTGKLSGNERSFVADMLISVLGNVSKDLRIEIATRLSGFTDIPHSLTRHLLQEDISVAGVVLEKASVIPEAQLLEAIQCSPDHRLLIAARDDLTDVLAEALLRYDEEELVLMVLKCQQVSISDRAMDAMVQRSRHDTTIRKPLLKRLELRLEQALEMFWWCAPAERRRLLSRFATDRTIIQEAMQPLFVLVYGGEEPDGYVRSMLHLIDRRHRPRGRNGEIVSMEIVERTLQAAQATATHDFAEAVGLLAGVSTRTAEAILKDLSKEPFAVLCKSLGLSRGAFEAVFHSEDIQYTGEQVDDWLAVFDGIARDYSRVILRYWDWKGVPGPEELAGPVGATNDPAEGSYFGAV